MIQSVIVNNFAEYVHKASCKYTVFYVESNRSVGEQGAM